jgi:osmotically inducible protein OsmC
MNEATMTALYTAHATATAGRNGHAETDDGVVKFDLSVPKPMGGEGKAGATNPEQLFAMGYAACFGGAVEFVAASHKIAHKGVRVNSAVTFNKDDSGFFISAALDVHVEGVDQATAEKLVAEAHTVCPYSKATKGNITVDLKTV